MREQELAKTNLILKTVTGSHLYGTETPESDLDYMGLFIEPKEYVYGLHRCDQVILNEKHKDTKMDYTCYSLMKYIKLARVNNPNIISMLYTPSQRISFVNDYGQRLIDNRHLFLSKKAYHSFRGYAYAQKRKILTKTAVGKRKELIEAHGYDTKFAMHLVRLLYECLDIMSVGQLVYPTPHRKLLRHIRAGEMELNQVLAESERLEKLIDQAYAVSSLQWASNDEKIEQLQMSLLKDYWEEGKE